MTGRNFVSFFFALRFPKSMLDTFMTLDSVMGKMETQHAKKKESKYAG